MKVALKSPVARRTLTLPVASLALLDELRGNLPKSVYLEGLLEQERARVEEERFFASVNAAYTPAVCEDTLRVNEEFPIHEG
jgi:hypothetical protein